MFIVVLTAVPTPRAAYDFNTTAGAKVTVFTCMLCEDDAVEIAHSMMEDSRWEVTSIDEIFWFGKGDAEDDPGMAKQCERARDDGPIWTVEYVDGASLGPVH